MIDLAKDRRVMSRLFQRVVVALVAVRTAVELAVGAEVAMLAGVDPDLTGPSVWVAALLHLAAGAALLHPVSRRGGAAGLSALLLAWLAWLGIHAYQVQAVVPAVLLFLTLGSAAPEDEGPFRPRATSWIRKLWFAFHVAGLGFFARWLLGSELFVAMVPVVGLWHHAVRRRLDARSSAVGAVLLYALVFWIGVGSLWSAVGHTFLRDTVARDIGWAVGSPFQLELAAYHFAFGGLGLAAFWIRDHLWTATALGKSVFAYGAAAVHLWEWQAVGNTSPGNVGFRVLVLGDLILPTVLVTLVILWLREPGGVNRRLGEG